MAWNLEVAAVRTDKPGRAVPDVFVPTGTTMGFEDATSVRRGPDLCTAPIDGWTMVVDVDCRLSEVDDYLAEASASSELHLVRISDEPVILHYRDGRPVLEARGLAECLEVVPSDWEDGETCAMWYFREATGVAFGDDPWWEASFTPYSP